MPVIAIVRKTIIQFCKEFLVNPYLCYTEHGQHALFYSMLNTNLPAESLRTIWGGQEVCIVQKEYPTAHNLGRSQRQHWDISVIKTPVESLHPDRHGYDYLRLAAVVEFGMNEAVEHLEDDIDRLCHDEANLDTGFIVHLYRLSGPRPLFSKRDWSPKSKRILKLQTVAELSNEQDVEIYYGMADTTGTYESGLWRIQQGEVVPLN